MLTLNTPALRALMRKQHLTPRDLSRKIGMGQDYVSHAMSDHRAAQSILPRTARRIADGLGVQVRDITIYVRR